MEEEGEASVEPIVVQRPAVARTPMRIDNFLRNRELASNKRVVRTFNADFAKNDFCQKDIREHTGCINAVQFSHNEQLIATGGDDMRCRVWRVDDLMLQKHPKPIMRASDSHTSNIFSLAFDLEERNIFSGERRGCILKHDIETSQCVYSTEDQRRTGDVYSLHHHPFDAHVILVAHAHSVCILDDRDQGRQTSLLTNDNYRKDFYSAEFHPISPVLMLINGEADGPNVYDRRNPSAPFYDRTVFTGLPNSQDAWMGAAWSPSGNQFMAIRRTSTPIYFDVVTKRCFELKPADIPNRYRNAKTIKSMTFIDDYTVATGSDHWGIHIWKCPRADDTCGFVQIDDEHVHDVSQLFIEKEMRVLRGHRSIPNQVSFSRRNQILVSSGVENSFKLWSHLRLPWSYDIPFERSKIGTYDSTAEEELVREKEERQKLEDELDQDDLMEGRACWNDVFGGDEATGEDRETLEMFDTMVGRDDNEDGDDDDDDDDDDDNENDRELFPMRRELDELIRFALLRRRFDPRADSSSDSDDDNDRFHEPIGLDPEIEVEEEEEEDDDDEVEYDPIEEEEEEDRHFLRFLEVEDPYDDEEDDEEEEGDEEMEDGDGVDEDEEDEEEEEDDEHGDGIQIDDVALAESSGGEEIEENDSD